MMNEEGRVERLEARVADLEHEVMRLSAESFRAKAAALEPKAAVGPPFQSGTAEVAGRQMAAPPIAASQAAASQAAAPQAAPPQAASPRATAPQFATPAPPQGSQFASSMMPASVLGATPKPRMSLEGLIAGRGLQIAGALLVLLGCAFFLDLAFSRGWIRPAERILMGLATGAALVGFGSRIVKPAYRTMGESLIGLGGGILYLSLWASIQVFPDLQVPHVAAFAAMIAVTAALSALAATRRSQATAIFGILGGFITPVLLAGGPTDRVVLAAYVLILAVAMLALAARYAFASLEVISLVGVLAYAGSFAPNPLEGWSNISAEIVATLFFLVFAVAVSVGTTSGANRTRRVTMLSICTVSYALVLELIFGADRIPRGISELILSAALLGAAQIRPLDRAMARAYGYLALGTITLALASLIRGPVLLDVLTIEAGIIYVAGRRADDRWLPGGAITLLAFIGLFDVLRDAYLERPDAVTAAISSAIWLAVAGYMLFEVRDAKDKEGTKLLLQAGRISFDIVAVSALTRACFDIFGLGAGTWLDSELSNQGEFAISAVWMAYGSGLFLYGLRRKTALLRWEGLALLCCTILKVFSVDLASVEIEWRVLTSIVLGGVLFVISALYIRSTNKAAAAAPGASPPPAPASAE